MDVLIVSLALSHFGSNLLSFGNDIVFNHGIISYAILRRTADFAAGSDQSPWLLIVQDKQDAALYALLPVLFHLSSMLLKPLILFQLHKGIQFDIGVHGRVCNIA